MANRKNMELENHDQALWGRDAPLIDLDVFKEWIVHEDENLLVMNKPGWVVCHPSKNGPLSSLVGAGREYTGLDSLHLISRLDRETSGLVMLAKNKRMASAYQTAIEKRQVKKIYYTLLNGLLKEAIIVDQPLARDIESAVYIKQAVRQDRTSQSARTFFKPIQYGGEYTLAEVELFTGRKHQIRAHAEWLRLPIVGDKLYGGDESLYLEFIEQGWTPRMAVSLKMKRQALHAAKMIFDKETGLCSFETPLPSDLRGFMENYFIE